MKNSAPLDIANCSTSFLSPSSSAGQAAARCAVNLYFRSTIRRGRPWRIDEIRELIIDICCGGRGRTQNSIISVSVEVEVEGRAERRAAAFLLCCWLLAARLACRIFCVCFPCGLKLSGLVSSSGCSILLYAHVYMCVGVWARGRLSPLPEDAKILGSGETEEKFYWSVWYNIVNSIQYCISFFVK